MKPSWDDAPAWAQWLAMDADGWWCWFENQPEFDADEWAADLGRFLLADDRADYSGADWDFAYASLESRP